MELYCIKCERMVKSEKSGVSGHMAYSPDYLGEFEFCEFEEGFAACPPPEFDEDWVYYVQDPSDEELEEMNKEANLLLADLEAE